jgi:hypothetical protein
MSPSFQKFSLFFGYDKRIIVFSQELGDGDTEGFADFIQRRQRGNGLLSVPGRNGGLRNSGKFCKMILCPATFQTIFGDRF